MSSSPTTLEPIIDLQHFPGNILEPKATLARDSFVHNAKDNGDYLFHYSSRWSVVTSPTKEFNVYAVDLYPHSSRKVIVAKIRVRHLTDGGALGMYLVRMGYAIDIGYTVAIKSLLVLQLQALYLRNKKGEFSKTLLFAAEGVLIPNAISHLRPLFPIDPHSDEPVLPSSQLKYWYLLPSKLTPVTLLSAMLQASTYTISPTCVIIGTDTSALKVAFQLEPIIWIVRLVTTSKAHPKPGVLTLFTVLQVLRPYSCFTNSTKPSGRPRAGAIFGLRSPNL
ncbi:hypothetical protein P691DRAFT_786646 [Macrolepiota fuliginosa MF-IS2]|uniref:Uncharacterized protein n=1 Tax=Macrolepiota fuliginosa MF-IS2 TaxID=1400762 RepID=A0A9P6C0D2_9AGAR|nr:hypothetical protein P691DRAFT_786646 [Macrolepiota fuliginosa MF-IS2]